MRLFSPGSLDPCLPGTNLHCSMNSISWLMEAQYGWKFLRTPYHWSWWGTCVSSAPSYGSTVDLATLKVQAADRSWYGKLSVRPVRALLPGRMIGFTYPRVLVEMGVSGR